MSFWDEVRKGLEEGAQALKKGAEVVAEKTEEAAKTAKLRYNIYTIRQEIKKSFTELGAHVFELAESTKPPIWKDEEVQSFVADIREGRSKIEKLETEIEAVSAKDVAEVTEEKPKDKEEADGDS